MQIKRLINVVLNYSADHLEGFKEYELISFIEQTTNFFETLDTSSSLGLFKKHFLIKHALYRCEAQIAERHNRRLLIQNVWISFVPNKTDIANSTEIEALQTHDKLRDYYLDWDNFYETSEEQVNHLIDDFWKRFFNLEQRSDALATLELNETATQQDIQKKFRSLAAIHHPDKGGDPDKFIEIRNAYESLKV